MKEREKIRELIESLAGEQEKRIDPERFMALWRGLGGEETNFATLRLRLGEFLGLSQMQALTMKLEDWVLVSRAYLSSKKEEPKGSDLLAAAQKTKKKKGSVSTAQLMKEIEKLEKRMELLETLIEAKFYRLDKRIVNSFRILWEELLKASRGEQVTERLFGREGREEEEK